LEDRTLLSLVAAYGFEEGAGQTVSDVSGLGHTGTISGASWTTSGKFGNALSFNGTSSLITIGDANDLDLTTGMTLEAWVDPTTVDGNWRDVIYKGNDDYFLSATDYGSGVPAAGATLGTADVFTAGTSALATHTWTFLTETYNGSALDLYVNGTLVSSLAQTGNIATSTDALQIGGDSLYGQYFAGLIDEVRVYNTALSQSQIATDMNTPVGGGGGVPADTTPPTVTSVAPLAGATGVLPNASVTVTFSEPIDTTTITAATFQLHDPSGNPVAATVSYNAATETATLAPVSPLGASSGYYTALVQGGATGSKTSPATPLRRTLLGRLPPPSTR
jgi:hypothetical protein